jgi:hypothetical protein
MPVQRISPHFSAAIVLAVVLAATACTASASGSATASGTRWHLESYSSSTVTPSDGAATSTLVSPAKPSGRIARLVVGVRLSTASARSVTLTLAGPGVAKPVTLAAPPLGSSATVPDGADFGSGSIDCHGKPAVFDDASTTYFDQAQPPFAGVFHPTSFVGTTVFLGAPAGGNWTLRASGPSPVTIACWTLHITREIAAPGSLFTVPDLLGSDVNTLFRKQVYAPAARFRVRYDCKPMTYPITIQENRRSDIITAQSPAPGKRVAARTLLTLSFLSSDWHAQSSSSCFASGTPGD